MIMAHLIEGVWLFIFWYPLVMSLVWIAGSHIFRNRREPKAVSEWEGIDWPLVSILIPCYNEAETIEETIAYMDKLAYPYKEIIAVNDGSSDQTGEILHRLAKDYADLRIIDVKENRGKATALKLASFASKAEYLVCVDSDAVLDDYAVHYLIANFITSGERLGAVTGNPRIRNRDTLLAKLQIVEYASIIGAIKRAQRVFGKVMTVSGVVVAFRKKSLVDVGLWDSDMITEDISVSWKLQQRFWDIRYETRALCWMLVPETLSGLWRQRVRWAQGGQEVILRHWKVMLNWGHRRIWPIYIEQWLSLLWSYSWVVMIGYASITADTIQDALIWFNFSAFFLVMLALIQLLSSIFIDSRQDSVWRYFFFGSWYPFVYWIVNTLIVIVAFPKAILSRIRGGDAVWTSPDRGARKESETNNSL
jgi:biofilm PGA synthesis N-glycosyltransferase PgaC